MRLAVCRWFVGVGLGEDDGELEEADRPDGEDGVDDAVTSEHLLVVKQREQLHNVGRDAEVLDEKVGQLLVAEARIRHQPATDDQQQWERLLHQQQPLLVARVKHCVLQTAARAAKQYVAY